MIGEWYCEPTGYEAGKWHALELPEDVHLTKICAQRHHVYGVGSDDKLYVWGLYADDGLVDMTNSKQE